MVKMGYCAVLFFALLHSGIARVSPAQQVPPHYADLVLVAQQYGIEVLCYNRQLSWHGMRIHTPLPIIIA